MDRKQSFSSKGKRRITSPGQPHPSDSVEVRLLNEHRICFYYVLEFEGEIIVASYCDGYLWESIISEDRKKKILAMAASAKLGLNA